MLGKLAVGAVYIPKEFSRASVSLGGSGIKESDAIERLKLNGVLIEKEGGLHTNLRFALDSIAQFLAAARYADECRPEAEKWDALLKQSSRAPGFQSALRLVRQAYGRK